MTRVLVRGDRDERGGTGLLIDRQEQGGSQQVPRPLLPTTSPTSTATTASRRILLKAKRSENRNAEAESPRSPPMEHQPQVTFLPRLLNAPRELPHAQRWSAACLVLASLTLSPGPFDEAKPELISSIAEATATHLLGSALGRVQSSDETTHRSSQSGEFLIKSI